MPETLVPGQRIERYVVEQQLGQGGMATVYQVRHTSLGTQHALKILSVAGPGMRQRLLLEGKVQASLRHPNIVAVTDVLEVGEAPGLLMEWVQGPSLDDFLRARGGVPLELAEAERIFRGILAGVAEAHRQGALHRDLKPANVILASPGAIPKVADFGLAKVMVESGGEGHHTRTGTALGTPEYMAPEQIRDAGSADKRADVFSLGCVLYELVVGERAFDGADIVEVFNNVCQGRHGPIPPMPARFEAAIRGALKVRREERIPDCEALLAVLDGRGADSRPPASGETFVSGETLAEASVAASVGQAVGVSAAVGAGAAAAGAAGAGGGAAAAVGAGAARPNARQLGAAGPGSAPSGPRASSETQALSLESVVAARAGSLGGSLEAPARPAPEPAPRTKPPRPPPRQSAASLAALSGLSLLGLGGIGVVAVLGAIAVVVCLGVANNAPGGAGTTRGADTAAPPPALPVPFPVPSSAPGPVVPRARPPSNPDPASPAPVPTQPVAEAPALVPVPGACGPFGAWGLSAPAGFSNEGCEADEFGNTGIVLSGTGSATVACQAIKAWAVATGGEIVGEVNEGMPMLAFTKDGHQVSVQCDSEGPYTTIAMMASG